MSTLFPGLVPAPTGEPVTPANADRLREADHVRPVDGLTDGDMQRGTMGHARIVDQLRRADGVAHFADLRTGGLIEDRPGFPWLGLVVAGAAMFWAALGLILLT